jgi:hypothetical protein
MKTESEFLAECWEMSKALVRQAWSQGEPLHPGHAADSPATRSLSAIRLGERLLLMSKTSEDGGVEPREECLFEGCIMFTAADLDRAINALRYDGWTYSKAADFNSIPDQSVRFSGALEAFYSPEEWSMMTAKKIVGVLSGESTSGSEYFAPQTDAFRVDPVAAGSTRTGVTTGITFKVYDDSLCHILDLLKVPYLRGDTVCNCLPTALVDKLVELAKEDALNEYKSQARAALTSELKATEKKLAMLQDRIASLSGATSEQGTRPTDRQA